MNLEHALAAAPPPQAGADGDSVLGIVMWIGVGTVAASLLMITVVVMLRLAMLARQRREREVVERWRPLLLECVSGVPRALPAIARGEQYPFLKLWNRYYESVRGEGQGNVRTLGHAAGGAVTARAMLASRSVRQRLIGITTLGHLRDHVSLQPLRSLADDPLPMLAITAARAALEIDTAGTLTWLPALIAEREDWPINKVAAMLKDAGADQTTLPLVAAAEAAASGAHAAHQVPRLLRLLDVAHAERAAPTIRRILRTATDPEVIAACLRMLHDPAEINLVRRLLAHPHWLVRSTAARALGRIGTREDRQQLSEILSDPHWWVRHHAAGALVTLLSVNPGEAEGLLEALGDRYAADALRQALAERR